MEFGLQNTHRCSHYLISFYLSVLILGLHQVFLVPALEQHREWRKSAHFGSDAHSGAGAAASFPPHWASQGCRIPYTCRLSSETAWRCDSSFRVSAQRVNSAARNSSSVSSWLTQFPWHLNLPSLGFKVCVMCLELWQVTDWGVYKLGQESGSNLEWGRDQYSGRAASLRSH